MAAGAPGPGGTDGGWMSFGGFLCQTSTVSTPTWRTSPQGAAEVAVR